MVVEVLEDIDLPVVILQADPLAVLAAADPEAVDQAGDGN
jgi:hypothetical protein